MRNRIAITTSLVLITLIFGSTLISANSISREYPTVPDELIGLDFHLDPDTMDISFDGGMITIEAEGFRLPFGYGEAALPCRTYQVLVHPLAENIELETVFIDSYRIPCHTDIAGIGHFDHDFTEEAQEVIPARSFPTDRVTIEGEGWIRGMRILDIRFDPIIRGDNDELIISTHLEATLSYDIGKIGQNTLKEPFSRSTSSFRSSLENDIMNPEDIERFPVLSYTTSSILTEEDVQYVIVTDTSKVGDAFDEIIEWKNEKGVPSKLVEMSFILSSYNGTDNAEKLRNFLIDAVDTWDTEFVLLGGDTMVVPYRGAYVKAYSYSSGWITQTSVASDLYYSDLDGDWNADNDNYWGEVEDNIDMKPDLYVGRAPVQTSSEADTFVLKTMTYEKEPPTGYLNNVTLAGEYLDSSTNSSKAMDMIKNNLLPTYSVPTSLFDSGYGSLGNLNRNNFMNMINLGCSLTFHSGHCNWNSMSVGSASGGSMYNSHISNYNGGYKLGVLNTIGCIANRFDKDDAIVELHVKEADGGTVAGIGNSHYGWYSRSSPGSGPSERVQYRMVQELFEMDNTAMAVHFAEGKEHYTSSSGSYGSLRWVQFVLNLLGDPEMDVRTRDPSYLNISIPESVGLDYQDLPVTIRSMNGTPVANALVCLKKSDYYDYGRTDSSGVVRFDYSSDNLDNLNVTVTAFDHFPATINLSVDIVSPEIMINSPLRGTTGDPFSLNLSVTDMAGIGNVVLETSDGRIFNLSESEGFWLLDLEIPHNNTSPIGFRISATDRSGNINVTSWMDITVEDDDLPVLNHDLTDNGATTGDEFTFSAEFDDNIGMNRVSINLNIPGEDPATVEMEPSGKIWTCTRTMPLYSTGIGNYSFSAEDLSGNLLQTEQSFIRIEDNDVPVFIEDLSDTRANTSDTFVLSTSVSDNIEVDTVTAEWWVEGWNLHRNDSMQSDGNGLWSLELEAPDEELKERFFIFHAVDTSGNWNSTYGSSVEILDGEAPSLLEDNSPASVNCGEDIVFSVKVDDNLGVDVVSVQLNTTETGIKKALVLIGDMWNVIIRAPENSTDDLTYLLTATDVNGNTAIFGPFMITVEDTIAPIITDTSIPPSADAGSTVNISLEAADNIGISRVVVSRWFSGEDAQTTMLEGNGTYLHSFEVPITSFGTLYLSFEIEDTEGNILESGRFSILIIEYVEPEPEEPEPRIPEQGEDMDGDGLDDSWEYQFDLDLEKNDSTEDPDRDGYDNLQEYIAGTSPVDPLSHPSRNEDDESGMMIILVVASIMVLAALVIILVVLLVLKRSRSDGTETADKIE